jgi:uncharacterized protein
MLIAAVAIAMAVGLIGTIVPVMPGLAIIWVAGLVFGILDGFGTLGIAAFAAMTVLLVMGTAASYVIPHRTGKAAGADRQSLRLGILGGIVGFFVIPVIGLPIGAVLGVWVGEQRRLGDWGRAWATTRRVVLGFGIGLLLEFTCGVLMVASWGIWAAWG